MSHPVPVSNCFPFCLSVSYLCDYRPHPDSFHLSLITPFLPCIFSLPILCVCQFVLSVHSKPPLYSQWYSLVFAKCFAPTTLLGECLF